MERKYDFKQIEESVLALWRAHKTDIDAIIKDENDTDKERFTFLEGPPTANAPPALHHVEMRVFKDLFTRFKSMQGYKVSRKGGWDCHGLPVEVQVEKKLGLKNKQDVVTYGVSKFIDECKRDVFSFIGDWTASTERLGFWVDLDKPYITLEKNYMESVWWALSEIYKKDLLYEGYKVVPYCGRCATPLSSHEVAQGYKDVEETTVTVTFPASNQQFFIDKGIKTDSLPVMFLAWTTTPWTLPSNLALAVHPKVEYAFVKSDSAIYVLARDLVSKYFGEEASIIATWSGDDLVGQMYVPLFDYFKAVATNSFRIIPADYVTTEDGTGIVHQAPAYGEDDSFVCAENKIDFVNPVNEHGKFTEEVPDFQGQFVKDADPAIIEFLKNTGRLFKTTLFEHSYPFCWRCKTPLIYYAKDTWFIRVSDKKVKSKLLEHNETVNWFPNTIKHGRFGNWLEGARDWALSRNKFWGTPLPIWICDNEECNHKEAISSIAELQEKTGVLVDDLHIVTVDPLTYSCPKCQGTMHRTSEVIDTWFDSGSAPFAQLHYPFENKDLFEELFPYDYIAEAIDQTRGWFYTLLVINTILFDKAPFKNVAVGGLLCDDNGDKMSKSKGNVFKPDVVFDEEGVDATRMVMVGYSLGNNIKFGPSVFKEITRPFFTTLWNTYFYVHSYLERFSLTGKEVSDATALEDEWMISKTNSLIQKVTSHLEKHEYNHAMSSIINFVDNTFSKTYIKLIRDRTKESDKELAFVFYNAFDAIVHVIAPFTPYIAEKIYQDFIKSENSVWSVHFSSWPKVGYRNDDLEREFEQAQSILQGILAARDKAGYGVRWPLSVAHVLTETFDTFQPNILKLIKTQANIKDVKLVKEFPVDLKFDIDFKKLSETFGLETGDVIPLVQKSMDLISRTLNKSETVVLDKWTLTRDMFKVTKIVPEPYKMAPFAYGEIYLDTTITPELEAEGFARELTRRVQNLRKESGLEKNDHIALVVEQGDLPDAVFSFTNNLIATVGADSLKINEPRLETSSEEVVKGKKFVISLKKL